MNIVIIGLGTIGVGVLQTIASDNHTITIIDDDKVQVERLIERYDVHGVVGNGASLEIQKEAGMDNADVAIVLTESDELNIFACLVAKKLGVKNTIARVRDPDYRQQIITMKDELGISMIVNPEQDTATEIFNLINLPAIAEVEYFANGKVLLVEIAVEKESTLINETLISIGQKLNTKVLICAIRRRDEVIIPSGHTKILEGDKIYFTANAKHLRDFLSEAKIIKSRLKNIMIVGGTRTSYYLANHLSKKKYNIKLIENDIKAAESLADALPNVTVVNGCCTQHDMLVEEGIEAMDAFVALTDDDEDNMIVSMFANKMGVKKTITQIKNESLNSMLSALDIENNVSPKDIVADRITSYIRALANSRGSGVLTLYRLVNSQVEALEFAAKQQSKMYGHKLRELKIKSDCLVACIIRNGVVIIPDGNATIQLGDRVVVVTTHKNFNDLTDVFEL